jgi:predicted ATP-binding protein involved in virulence
MRVKRLSLNSFRGFDRVTLEFAPDAPTVIIGNNGLGKSSILDALATLLSWLVHGIESKPKPTLLDTIKGIKSHAGKNFIGTKDIKAGSDRALAEITVELDDRSLITWSLSNLALATGGERINHNFDELKPLSDRLTNELSAGQQPNLILVVHYPVNRAVLDMPLEMPDNYAFQQLDAYQQALGQPKITFNNFFQWFRAWEDLENEQRRDDPDYRDKYLEAVRQAIYALIPEFANLRVRRNPLRMTVMKNANNHVEEFSLEQLSDGEKCLLAMVGDLARRLALANPRLENPLKGNGIVLIDEIELHLHPEWQRQILPKLTSTFSNCQFIVTTHSPQIVSHVKPENVYCLTMTEAGIQALPT